MPRSLGRSYKPITKLDLGRLRDLALEEVDRFFTRRNDLRRFRHKLIAITLCQGAAVHCVDSETGVNDFDIFFFFGEYDRHLVNRMPTKIDSKLHKFGVHPEDAVRGFQARHIDFLRRAIDANLVQAVSGDPAKAIVEYLKQARTKTAQELAKRAVVGLWPDRLFGKVLWSNH